MSDKVVRRVYKTWAWGSLRLRWCEGEMTVELLVEGNEGETVSTSLTREGAEELVEALQEADADMFAAAANEEADKARSRKAAEAAEKQRRIGQIGTPKIAEPGELE